MNHITTLTLLIPAGLLIRLPWIYFFIFYPHPNDTLSCLVIFSVILTTRGSKYSKYHIYSYCILNSIGQFSFKIPLDALLCFLLSIEQQHKVIVFTYSENKQDSLYYIIWQKLYRILDSNMHVFIVTNCFIPLLII